MYLQWNCKKHGSYQFREKYRPNCKECFVALKQELADLTKSFNETNSERVNALYESERLKKILGRNFADYILKGKL